MKSFLLAPLCLVVMWSCSTSTNLTNEFVPANLTKRLTEILQKDNPNIVLTRLDSVTSNDVVWITFREALGDSSRIYTLAYGMPEDFAMPLPTEFIALTSQIRYLGANPKLLAGEVKNLGSFSDSTQVYLVNDILKTPSRKVTTGRFLLLSNYKWRVADEPIIQSNCNLFAAEDTHPNSAYPDCGMGTFSTFEIADNTVTISLFEVLADAQFKNWGSEVSKRVYQWSGEQFFFMGDQLEPEGDISDNINFDDLLTPFIGKKMQLIEKINDEWVIQVVCFGGIPNITIYNENGTWLLREMWYQDVMDYEISAVAVEDASYEMVLNPYQYPDAEAVIFEFQFDEAAQTIATTDHTYALNPETYPRIKEECEEVN
jgi:hypothetical protein